MINDIINVMINDIIMEKIPNEVGIKSCCNDVKLEWAGQGMMMHCIPGNIIVTIIIIIIWMSPLLRSWYVYDYDPVVSVISCEFLIDSVSSHSTCYSLESPLEPSLFNKADTSSKAHEINA